MLSDFELLTLQSVARGGTMNYERWPAMFDSVTERLNEIARNEFPIRKSSRRLNEGEFQARQSAQPNDTTTSQSADKENTPPSAMLSNHAVESEDVLPQELLLRLNSVLKTLTSNFKTNPPHTVQRLAELILEPRKQYRSLPAYLHALDRVVSVTSGADIYPLPAVSIFSAVLRNGSAAGNSNGVSWGKSTTAQPMLGSDESLGGALLTPIPWLINGNTESNGSDSRSGSRGPIEREVRTESTETIEGPNGAGSVETVTVSVYNSGIPNQITSENTSSTIIHTLRAEGGVTQGELIREEQELNVVPAAQQTAQLSDADAKSEEDELPYARGPQEIGVEDMGPQASNPVSDIGAHGMNVEAAVGRRADGDGLEKDVDAGNKQDTGMALRNQETETSTPASKREADEGLAREAKKPRNEDGDGYVEDEEQSKNELEEGQKEEQKEEQKEDRKEDEDLDMLLVDADGKAEGEKKAGEGENSQVGADAVDTTSI